MINLNDYYIELHREAEANLIADAPLLLEEVLRLREQNEILNEQLSQTRRWLRHHQRTLKLIAYQAEIVACSAEKVSVDEMIGDGQE